MRQMMIAVAVVAIVIGATIGLERRRSTLLRIARSHGERVFLLTAGDIEDEDEFKRSEALADHHYRLMNRHARAARYPWLPIEPDPPEPE
jgi:hypothetical protein